MKRGRVVRCWSRLPGRAPGRVKATCSPVLSPIPPCTLILGALQTRLPLPLAELPRWFSRLALQPTQLQVGQVWVEPRSGISRSARGMPVPLVWGPRSEEP